MKTGLPIPATAPALSRRHFLAGAAALAAGFALPGRTSAQTQTSSLSEALAAARKSPLVYVSPLKKNGLESRCHAEVWFVTDGDDLLVVTNPGRWRAACIERGLDRARLWVGDFGPWKKSKGAFREAPSFVARASIDGNRAAQERALESFGRKYTDEWGSWGPRFRDGLASGERVMIRYSPTS